MENNPLTERLNELERETDFEFVVELVDIYLNESPKLIEAIEKHFLAQEMPHLTIAAHTLKGSSKNLGANHLGDLCYRFEEYGRTGVLPDDPLEVDALRKEYANVDRSLTEFKKR
jgi:HPt (histidine-containing phosphotransfer) domain-containing protein